MTKEITIKKIKGDTIKLRFKVKNGTNAQGQPTYYALDEADAMYLTVKANTDVVTPVIQVSTDDYITYDAQTSKFTVTIPSSLTADLEDKGYKFDIKLFKDIDDDGEEETLLLGDLILIDGVTGEIATEVGE